MLCLQQIKVHEVLGSEAPVASHCRSCSGRSCLLSPTSCTEPRQQLHLLQTSCTVPMGCRCQILKGKWFVY